MQPVTGAVAPEPLSKPFFGIASGQFRNRPKYFGFQNTPDAAALTSDVFTPTSDPHFLSAAALEYTAFLKTSTSHSISFRLVSVLLRGPVYNAHQHRQPRRKRFRNRLTSASEKRRY